MTVLAIGLLLLIGYTYAGYPALVALLAHLLPRRIQPRLGFEPTVSVCLAVHNGAGYLQQKLESLKALDYPPERLEILIYSDGSTDDTEALARAWATRDPRVRLLSSPHRLGKPSGLNRLYAEATGEVLLMTDVRQQLAKGALRALLEPLSDPEIGCVSGSLVLAGEAGSGAYWRYEKFIRTCEARLGSMVGVSGSLYAIRREHFGELPHDLLLDDMFVPLQAARHRKRIVLAEAAEAYDDVYADEQELGRKVRTLAGNYQLLAKLPWLLSPQHNPVWFQLVSHKVSRLLCPFALVGLLLVSGWLALSPSSTRAEQSFWLSVWAAQLVCYFLALCGARAGRLGALARTFVILNVAAVLGLWRFLRRSQSVAW
jgi:biofilm PGA synthesis N-glycosyltransferase PgaC